MQGALSRLRCAPRARAYVASSGIRGVSMCARDTGWVRQEWPSSARTLRAESATSGRVYGVHHPWYGLWNVTQHEYLTSRPVVHGTRAHPTRDHKGDRRSYVNTLTGTALCRSACAASKCPARRRPAPCERHGPACSTPALDRLLLDEDGGLLLEDDGHLDDAGGRGLGLGRGDERADAQAPAA